jgi:Protein of unknown function (DUF2914)
MFLRGAAAALVLTQILWDSPAGSQDKPGPAVTVEEGVIATGVEKLIPVAPGRTFDANIGRLYCFTRIKTNRADAVIKHLWFHGDIMVMEVSLPIKSSNWRTYSTKTILPSATGHWRVDVTSDDGTILKRLNFTIQ